MAVESTARMVAQNTFENGLIMDFSPERTGDKCLSNALNATFLTFNGNEMSLQNDMGNARVESAYLPDGYVPVGTCEFGDIIYIVSYNPIDNRSLIGCFPSPERNISNKEVSLLEKVVDSTQFISNKTDAERNSESSGIINSTTIRQIIYDKNINTGDKFIISWGNLGEANFDYISNYGNSDNSVDVVSTYWPKLIKLRIVSIEDSGKITYLDNTVKWYKDDSNQEYTISNKTLVTDDGPANLDTYRSALLCAYSVFLSKIPGKLAILFELEQISSFNCGHKIFKRVDAETSKNVYDIYLSASWETDNYNINPSGMIITSSTFTNMKEVAQSDNTRSSLLSVAGLDTQEKIYDISRVIEFTRIYTPENLPDLLKSNVKEAYINFINGYSYYTDSVIKKYTEAGIEGCSTIATSAIRVYEYDDKLAKRLPRYDSETGNGYYVLNPVIYHKYENSYTYQAYINNLYVNCPEVSIPDDIVVNYYKKSVLKKLTTVVKADTSVTESEASEKNLHTIEYTVCPCMPYGVLDSLAVTNLIDFDRINTGEVELTTWKYYVNTTSVTLQFGVTPYLNEDEGEVIDKILIEFYDNQGICATYELTGQESYDGVFTEYIVLDKESNNHRITTKKAVDGRDLNENIFHRGGEVFVTNLIGSKSLSSYYINYNGKNTFLSDMTESELQRLSSYKANLSNAGILYYGRPYGCRIKIFKGVVNELGTIDSSGYEEPIIYDRWLWTAGLFNDNYVNVKDFKECTFTESLDYSGKLNGSRIADRTKNIYTYLKKQYFDNNKDTFRAKVTNINQGEIQFTGKTTIANSYGSSVELNPEILEDILVITVLDNPTISIPTEFTTEYEEYSYGEKPELYPLIDQDGATYNDIISKFPKDLYNMISNFTSGDSSEVFNLEISNLYDNYNTLKECFQLDFKKGIYDLNHENALTFNYLDSNGEWQSCNSKTYYVANGKTWLESSKEGDTKAGIWFTLDGVKFTKIMALKLVEKSVSFHAKPAIATKKDLTVYSLALQNDMMYHTKVPFIAVREGSGEDGEWGYGVQTTSDHNVLLWNPAMHEEGDDINLDLNNTETFGKITNTLLNFSLIPVILAEGYYLDRNNKPYKWEASVDVSGMTSLMLVFYEGPEIQLRDLNNRMKGKRLTGSELNNAQVNFVQRSRINELGYIGENLTNFPVVLSIKDDNDQSIRVGGDIKFYFNTDSGGKQGDVDVITISQVFPWSTNLYKNNNYYGAYVHNLATLIAGWYSLIYTIINDPKKLKCPSQIASIQEYSESWDAYIVVSQNFKTFTETAKLDFETSTSRVIVILPNASYSPGTLGVSLFWYVATILNNMYNLQKDYDNDSWKNITSDFLQKKHPEILEVLDFTNINPDFLESIRAIKFSYSLPDNTLEFRETLLIKESNCYLTSLEDLVKGSYLLINTSSTDTSKPYYYNLGVLTLDEYIGQDLPFYTRFALKSVNDTEVLELQDCGHKGNVPIYQNSGIIKCMYINNGVIRYRNLGQLNSTDYYITVPGENFDTHLISGLKGFSIFDVARVF